MALDPTVDSAALEAAHRARKPAPVHETLCWCGHHTTIAAARTFCPFEDCNCAQGKMGPPLLPADEEAH